MVDSEHKINYIKQYLEYLISYTINYPLSYPKEINFQMTNRCPLRCKMCNISKIQPSENELTVEEMKIIIDEVKNWGTKYISFVGGEALVRKNETMELIRYANRKGFHTTLISSGYFLTNDTCRSLIDFGLNRLTISLDGATRKTHDFIRGGGSFDKAINAMKKMLELRNEVSKNEGKRITLDFSTVVMSYNFRELVDVYKLAKEIGVDQIFYQAVVMDNTYKSDASDYEKCDFWIRGNELAELENVIKELISIKKRDGNFIFNSVTYLKLIPKYFRLKEKFNPGRCLAGYMGLNIDPYGFISVCGLGPDINVRDDSLSKLWRHEKFKEAREKIKKCKIPCLMLCYGKFETKELLKHIIKN